MHSGQTEKKLRYFRSFRALKFESAQTFYENDA